MARSLVLANSRNDCMRLLYTCHCHQINDLVAVSTNTMLKGLLELINLDVRSFCSLDGQRDGGMVVRSPFHVMRPGQRGVTVAEPSWSSGTS